MAPSRALFFFNQPTDGASTRIKRVSILRVCSSTGEANDLGKTGDWVGPASYGATHGTSEVAHRRRGECSHSLTLAISCDNHKSCDAACHFPAMIHSWRTRWRQPELPFYYVLLAAGHTALLREAQVATRAQI